jgi:4-hydroxy-3-methylbut-2-enyl diphosphate reductase
MKILRADHLGMCFGVRDAIRLAVHQAQRGPLTVLGDLVHNETVLARLRGEGIEFASRPEHARTETVMITAHGASEKRLAAVAQRGQKVVEATCPLVRWAHQALASLVREGYHPVIVGQPDHVEVRGMTEDLTAFDVVLTEADLDRLGPWRRLGVVAQTTQPVERVRELVQACKRKFPDAEVRWIDTVCRPTKERQTAAVDLARRCDVVIVIGGAHSNNTRELVGTCGRQGARVYHVQTADQLQEEWVGQACCVGITAGTSTPDDTIDAVERRLQAWAAARAPLVLADQA